MNNRYTRGERQAAMVKAHRLAQTGRYRDSMELENDVPDGRVLFDNPSIRDELDRLCAEAWARLSKEQNPPSGSE